ncbi:MAG: beta-ketoacyl-[acyl-carrier-protein] synthase family protein [Candidatus Omnitrophota bacterium]
MNKRIVITGLGVLASNGNGRKEYWQALREGKPGYDKVTLFETGEFAVDIAAEIRDFDASVYLGKKGLRTLDRSTRLLVSASKMAIADSGFEITDKNTGSCGVSVGTTLGSVKSIADFDIVTLTEGPRYVNPALFPNTVINSPASQVSIWNNIQGFNNTLASGFTTSIDAMMYAAHQINLHDSKYVLAGGVEEMCNYTFWGFYALQFLSGSVKGQEFVNCPFDRRRNGIVFGEGAMLMSMEPLEHAKSRNAKIMGEVVSFGYEFDPFRIHKYNPKGTGLKGAMNKALENAGMEPRDIDCIFANANSTPSADRIEAAVIKEVFGEHGKKVPVTATKSMTGECYSVSGGMAVAAALGSLDGNFIPPTINYLEFDPECDLNVIANKSVQADLINVMVVNFSPSGANTCMILRKIRD